MPDNTAKEFLTGLFGGAKADGQGDATGAWTPEKMGEGYAKAHQSRYVKPQPQLSTQTAGMDVPKFDPAGVEPQGMPQVQTAGRPAGMDVPKFDPAGVEPRNIPAEAKATPKADGSDATFMEFIDKLYKEKALSADEEKRRKREGLMAGITDGLSALSNLIFTTQYAPNAYNPKDTMTAKWQERWDKLVAEREKTLKDKRGHMLTAFKYDRDNKVEADKLAYTKSRNAAKDAIEVAKAERQKAIDEITYKLRTNQMTKAEADAKKAAAEAKYAEELGRLNVDNAKKRGRQIDASTAASNSAAAYNKAKADALNEKGSAKVWVGGTYISKANWEDDDYIEQLWNVVKPIAEAGVGGAARAVAGKDGAKANVKRSTIRALLEAGYNPDVEEEIMNAVSEFEDNYSD